MTPEELFTRIYVIMVEKSPDYAKKIWDCFTEESKKSFDEAIRELAAEIVFTKPPEE